MKKVNFIVCCIAFCLNIQPVFSQVNASVDQPNGSWIPLIKGDRFDPNDDQQSNADTDFVGNATYALMETQKQTVTFTDGITDEVYYFRARMGQSNPNTSFYFGIDVSGDLIADVFIEANVKAQTPFVSFHVRDYSKTGISPSQTAWLNGTQNNELFLTNRDAFILDYSAGTDIDGGNSGTDFWIEFAFTEEILKRIDGHLSSNPGFKYVFTYQSKNNKLIEKCIKALLDPFITNKNEWFNIESRDLIYLVEFFIELFDKNNGSEDPKLIIDFIKNISKKELPQEFICNELYDDFFETNIEIDNNGDKNYKCTLISIQKEFEKYLREHEFNKQIRGNIKYLDVYTLDIKRYIKYKFNKTCERINIDDAKSNIHIGSTFGFCGFRMKKLYVDSYFDSSIYKNFIDQYLVVTESEDTVSLSQILIISNKYLNDNNIDHKLIKQNKYFKTSFREELLKTIEQFMGLQAIKRPNSNKKNGYSFFIGINIKLNSQKEFTSGD